jgi:DNA-binding CsgD family transcriptional regulator
MKFPDLSDRVYEASVLPELWEDLLTEMSNACGAIGGVVFTASPSGITSVVTPSAAPIFTKFVEGNWDSVNSRRDRANRLNHAGFVTDLDVFTEEEMRNEPLYRDFLYPEGLGWSVGSHIVTPDGDMLAVSFDREYAKGPVPWEAVEWLDGLRPHLARSLSLTARLKEKAAAAITDTLGAFGLAACMLDARGRMKAVNALMTPLVPSYIADRRDRVMLTHIPSDRLLAAALSREISRREVMSIPVPPVGDIPASVIHVVPVVGRGRDLFPSGLNVLAISFAGSSNLPDAPILRGLFDLTPAEARVSGFIARGMSPGEVALQAGMATNTVKHHLKAVYDKTGVNHYGALVRLLCGMGLQAPTGEDR